MSSKTKSQKYSSKKFKSKTIRSHPRHHRHHNTNKSKSISKKTNSSRSLEYKEKITKLFLEMLNTIKLYHWKTKSYAEHKATDELQEELHTLVDQFVEVMLGKEESRLKHIGSSIDVYDFENNIDFKERIYKYRDFLIGLDDIFTKKDSDLLSIRDDMLAGINKFLYLLTLHG
jgi:hypothetical protein